jgi:hypothetical protein
MSRRVQDTGSFVPFTIILGLTSRFLFNPTRVLSGVAWKHGALRDGCRRDGEVCSLTSPGPHASPSPSYKGATAQTSTARF